MRWCFLFCVVALVVSLSANDEEPPVEPSLSPAGSEQQAEERSDSALDGDDYVYDLDMVETAVDDDPEATERSDDYLDDEGAEELPEPEALTDDEEPAYSLDSIVAEQLIQELDDIGNKLQDDEETVGSSRQISSADVKKLEKLLESAGLTPHSPLMHTLMSQRKNAVPASALGPDMDGISGLRSLIGGGTPVGGGAAPSSLLAPRAMTRKNVEDIKRELKLMLFGASDGQKQKRRQGSTAGRRPSGARPQQRNKSRRPAQTRQQVVPSSGQRKRPLARPVSPNEPLQAPKTSIPVFLRPPRPIRPGASLPASSRQRPLAHRPAAVGRPVNDIARQPISEFRQPPSDFRLPEAPFRQQVAATSFIAPPLRTNNNVNQLSASVRSPPLPSQIQLPPRPLSVPRPTEVEFRQVLLSNNNRPATKQLPPPPKAFQLPPPPGPIGRPSTPALTNIQRPAHVASAPSRPILGAGAGIFTTSHFDTAPAPSAREPPPRNNIIQPDCELFAEGVCLSVRNYPTDIISNYLNKHRPELENMLAEVRSQSADDLVDGISAAEERKYSYNHYYGNRRQGEDAHAHRDFAEDGGFLCPSEVKYARPQLAQTSRGVWKYIINMNEHTQTIRMERCLKPGNSCSYVSPHYKSHCIQVYNYHRLLSFEEGKGMHVDIYKIPVGCSCHVQGYAYLYPPLDGKTAGHIIPPAFSTVNSGNTLNRKTSTTPREPVRTAAPELKLGREDTPTTAGGFLPPDAINDFASFMDQQFKGHFGPFSGKGGSSRRQDGDYIEEDPMEKSASEDHVHDYHERRKNAPTNYDYHPIIDYFHDKP